MGLLLQIVLILMGGLGLLLSFFTMPKSLGRLVGIIVSSSLLALGLVLTVLTYADPPTAAEIAERVVAILQPGTTPSKHPVDEKLPGFATGVSISTEDVTAIRRKYFFDYRTPEKSAVSLYLSADDHFIFSVKDIYGESHPLEVRLGADGVPFGKFIFLFCEVGVASNYSYLRMLVNGKQVGRIEIPVTLSLGSRRWIPTFGADAYGQNGGSFSMLSAFAFSTTLTDEEIKKVTESALRAMGAPSN